MTALLASLLAGTPIEGVVDTGFRLLAPAQFERVVQAIDPQADASLLERLHTELESLLDGNDVAGVVYGRTKSVFSIHRKMQRKNADIDAIHDRVGLRVILPDIASVYRVAELIGASYDVDADEVDDYIANPKPSGYQSLHLTLRTPMGPAEVQLRTLDMHIEATTGSASHWRYKLAA